MFVQVPVGGVQGAGRVSPASVNTRAGFLNQSFSGNLKSCN
jgi:hypothetical protein